MGTIQKLWRRIRSHGPFVVGFALAAALLLVQLGTLPVADRISQSEADTATYSVSLRGILDNPLYLPYSLLQWVSTSLLSPTSTVALRLPSVIFALGALVAMVLVIRRWYGHRMAVFSFLYFMSAAVFLHVGRLATFDILYLAAIPVMLFGNVALSHSRGSQRSFFVWLIVSTAALYVPGLVWFVLLGLVWQRQLLLVAFQGLGRWIWQLLAVTMAAVGLAPLIYGFVHNASLDYVLTWLGLPTVFQGLVIMLKNVAAAIAFIGIRTPEDPTRWLGHLPLLGAFMLVCFIAGILFYGAHRKAERTRLLTFITVIALLLLAAGGPVPRLILAPVIFVVAFGGLAYILHFWLKVFPRNQIARRTGIGLVVIALGLTIVYNLRHYYVAWPHNRDTQAVFTLPAGPANER